MKNKHIFVACDTSNLNEIKKIIYQTNSNKLKIIPKFGLQFFYSKNGRKFLEKYGSEGSGKNLPFSSLSEDLKKKEEEKE